MPKEKSMEHAANQSTVNKKNIKLLNLKSFICMIVVQEAMKKLELGRDQSGGFR